MTEGDQNPAGAGPVRRVVAPAADVIDCGVSPLHVGGAGTSALQEVGGAGPAALEVTHFHPPGDGPTTAAEIIEYFDDGTPAPVEQRGLLRRIVYGTTGWIAWLIQSLFGIASLILLLALIAAIPIVNFLALGYLLEVEGRMARSGKLRDAFPLLRQAPRLGSIALGIWAWIIPLRLLSNAAADARLIDPGSFADVSLHVVVTVMSVLVTVHLCLALAHGGSLWAFMWPLVLPLGVAIGGLLLLVTARYVLAGLLLAALIAYAVHRGRTLEWLNGVVRGWAVSLYRSAKAYLAYLRSLLSAPYWNHAAVAVSEFVTSLRLKHHFLLGFKGFVGAFIWLFVPTLLFAAARKTEGGPILVTLLGGVLLMLVLSWVPFLQAHYAAENRFGAMFELRTVRKLFKNAPFSWMIIMLVTLALALPMYLFKVRLPPSDALWMETIVFIVTIYPVKVITGWAYHRAATRERRAFFGLRWLTRLVLLPLLAFYVFVLFFTQFIGQHGKLVLLEHHAFLLPAPFGLFR